MKVIIKHNQVNHVIPLDAVIAVEKSETAAAATYPASMWRFTIVMIGGYTVIIQRVELERNITPYPDEYVKWTKAQQDDLFSRRSKLYEQSIAEIQNLYDQFMTVWEPEQRFVTIGG